MVGYNSASRWDAVYIRTEGTRRHNNKGPAHCDHLFIPKRTADARSDRSGYLSLSEIHSFSFRTLRAGGGEGDWRGEWSARGSEAGDTTGSGRVLPRANDIVTITVTTYPSTEWWRVTACLDSAKPRGSKIHWSGGCDPAVSMLLGRYVWLATLQRTYYHPRPSTPLPRFDPRPTSPSFEPSRPPSPSSFGPSTLRPCAMPQYDHVIRHVTSWCIGVPSLKQDRSRWAREEREITGVTREIVDFISGRNTIFAHGINPGENHIWSFASDGGVSLSEVKKANRCARE